MDRIDISCILIGTNVKHIRHGEVILIDFFFVVAVTDKHFQQAFNTISSSESALPNEIWLPFS